MGQPIGQPIGLTRSRQGPCGLLGSGFSPGTKLTSAHSRISSAGALP